LLDALLTFVLEIGQSLGINPEGTSFSSRNLELLCFAAWLESFLEAHHYSFYLVTGQNSKTYLVFINFIKQYGCGGS
jgi:hypothetical protein